MDTLESLRKQVRRDVFLDGLLPFIVFSLIGTIIIESQFSAWGLAGILIYNFSLLIILILRTQNQTQKMMSEITNLIEERTLIMNVNSGAMANENEILKKFSFSKTISKKLEKLLSLTIETEYQKTTDKQGRLIYKTRGKDPKGPASGIGADTFGEIVNRVDAMTARPELEGIEGPLTKSEKLVEKANEIAAEKALKEWAEAEANDPDLIEAGVEKLGDLVASGHFGGPEKPA